jgi:hypothetical protein
MRVSRSAALPDTSVTKQPLGTKLGTVAEVIGSGEFPKSATQEVSESAQRSVFLLTDKPKQFRLYGMKQSQVAEVMSWMGKRSYATRVQRFGIERIREIARENGKKGGRPRKEQKTNKL